MSRRIVVVTGASSGIGQGIAAAFAQSGAWLVIHGHQNVEGLALTQAMVAKHGQPCQTVRADISLTADRLRLVDEAFSWQKRVDVWINAAGADVLTGPGKQLAFEAKLDRLLQVDVVGTICVSRAVAERMCHQPNSSALPLILNLSWDQAEHGMEGDSGQYFAATKAAVAAFSKSLAKSVAPKVRVNCIAPGWIQTAWGKTTSADWDQRARQESMLQRWGTVADVAQAALVLADPKSDFINGQTICVNGGLA